MIGQAAARDLHARARAAEAVGLCVLPPKADGSKQPDAISWTRYQHQRSTPAEIAAWYAGGHRTGIGYVCGAVSGHLELLEFDDLGVYDRFLVLAAEAGLGDLAARVMAGYEEATPGGGVHWLYRLAAGGARTAALARRPGVDAAGKPRALPLVETKGEGGYVVAAPSYGSVHPSGNPYLLRSGGVETIAALTEAERDALWSLARTLDETARPAEADPFAATATATADDRWLLRPGDDFAARTAWADILEPRGWEAVRQVGEETLWRRPGGHPGGWGASTNHAGTDRLWVWTSAAPPLLPDTGYGKFAAYTMLEHGGDYPAAARALEAQGYGTRRVTTGGPSSTTSGSSAGSSSSASTPAPLLPVPPFPMDTLPPVVRAFVEAGAAALGCPPDFVVPHLLTFCGAVAGNSRKLRLKTGYELAPIFWTGVVGKPGTVKSPALNLARRPLDLLQKVAWERWQAERAAWEQGKPAERGAAPRPEHIFATDTTTEAVAFALMTSRGIAVVHDELAGWVGAFDAYRKAGDRQTWLSAWSGSPLKPNRKTGDPIYVPDPVVGVTGGIQPDVLPELAGEAARNDGFLPRLLLVWPDAEPQPWSASVVEESVAARMAAAVAGLRLPGEEVVVTTLSAEADREWVAWYDESQTLTGNATGLAAGWGAKAPVHLGRIALVLHLLAHPKDRETQLSGSTMRDAVAVVEYFRAHLARVLPAFGAAGPAVAAGLPARLHRILANDGGWVARSVLAERLGGHEPAESVTTTLRHLEESKRAERRTVPTGGRCRPGDGAGRSGG